MSSVYFSFGDSYTEKGEPTYTNSTIDAVAGEISKVSDELEDLVSDIQSESDIKELYSDYVENLEKSYSRHKKMLAIALNGNESEFSEKFTKLNDKQDDADYEIESYREDRNLSIKSLYRADEIVREVGCDLSFRELAEYHEGDLNTWVYQEDGFHPIYNHIHLLDNAPRQEDIVKMWKATGQVVITTETSEGENHYIALTGCGMGMSQSIGLSYIILQDSIPMDFIGNIDMQHAFTISDKNWKILMAKIKYQAEKYSSQFKYIKEYAQKAITDQRIEEEKQKSE